MSPRITEEQLRLLEKLVDAYWSELEGGTKEDFEFWASLGRDPTIEHRNLEEEPLDLGDMRELEAQGLVSIGWKNEFSGRGRPTADGKSEVEKQRRIRQVVETDKAISGGCGPGVGWEDTLPILQTVVDLYNEAGPGEGVSQPQVCKRLGRNEGDSGVSRAFEVLERSGYLMGEMEIDSVPGPLTAAPTEKALQLLAGWPSSGDAAAAKLLSILDEQIAHASSEEEKGKLRKLRESVVDIGESITAEVLVKLLSG